MFSVARMRSYRCACPLFDLCFFLSASIDERFVCVLCYQNEDDENLFTLRSDIRFFVCLVKLIFLLRFYYLKQNSWFFSRIIPCIVLQSVCWLVCSLPNVIVVFFFTIRSRLFSLSLSLSVSVSISLGVYDVWFSYETSTYTRNAPCDACFHTYYLDYDTKYDLDCIWTVRVDVFVARSFVRSLAFGRSREKTTQTW